MKRYKLTEKGKDVFDGIKYVLITGFCVLILMHWMFVIGIYVLTIMGYIF